MSTSTSISTFIRLGVKSLGIVTVAAAATLPALSQASTVPGQIVLFAGECPGGYLPADGSLVDLTAYPELASVVQNSYGGTGGTMGSIGLPSVDSDSVVADSFDYLYSADEVSPLASPATAYLVKVSDSRNLRNVVEVSVPKKAKGDLEDPQGLIPYIASLEKATGATVENYVIRTKSGFSLANGQSVARGTEATYWFGAYCNGNNGNCASTNKSIESISLSDLTADELDDFGRPVRDSKFTGYLGNADDMNEVDDPTLENDFAPFQPTYCVAVGGDTAPVVEVGLSFIQGEDYSGELEFNRVDVSGYTYDELPPGCFEDGNLCLDALEAANPGIGRPNISFRIVGENVCSAAEVVEVVESVPCDDTGNVGDNTVVDRYVVDTLADFCDAVGGVVHSSGNFCESKSRADKLNNGLCNALGGERGDRRNSDAISPICLPPSDLAGSSGAAGAFDIKTDIAFCSDCSQPSEFQCVATSFVDLPYPGELKMSGLQIAAGYTEDKDNVPWGNDFELQREALLNGEPITSDFAYITKTDEEGRQGFVAADLVDERTLILENRNVSELQEYQYRVQAQCGDGADAYNVYYDPRISTSGGGGSSLY